MIAPGSRPKRVARDSNPKSPIASGAFCAYHPEIMIAAALSRPIAQHLVDLVAIPGVRLGLTALGWLLALVGVVTFGATLAEAVQRDGGLAYDFHSYWLAGERLIAGQAIYARVEINDPGAYRYAPTFVAAFAPLSLMPELPLTWLYRGVSVLCLRYLVGSWRGAGWALLLPPVAIELVALNLTFPIAAASRWALRGSQTAAFSLPLISTLKYGSALLIPYLWFRQPERRRGLLMGAAVTAGIILVHIALAPGMWLAFGESLVQQSRSVNDAPFVGDQLLLLVPSTLGDFLIRLGVAALLTAVAARRGWSWLAFTAATIAVPTLWLARLAPLVAVPRLLWEDHQARIRSRTV